MVIKMEELLRNIFLMIGGLGLLIYGLNQLRGGLLSLAGGKLKQIIGIATAGRGRAFLTGAAAAGALQSSSVVTVMAVEFVEIRALDLAQAGGVMMGANVGTCLTAWMLCLETGSRALAFLQPSLYAPLVVGAGAFLLVFCSSKGLQAAGQCLLGLGLLFLGLQFMKEGASAYASLPAAGMLFRFCAMNPFLGILLGTLAAAVTQSSSVVMGLLQIFTGISGNVNMASAIYISLGANLGTCVTAMAAGAGRSKPARQAAMIHLLFNAFGAVAFGVGYAVYFGFRSQAGAQSVNAEWIAVFHTVYNLLSAVILLPFTAKLTSLTGRFCKDSVNLKK